jgi:hypothetical protein
MTAGGCPTTAPQPHNPEAQPDCTKAQNEDDCRAFGKKLANMTTQAQTCAFYKQGGFASWPGGVNENTFESSVPSDIPPQGVCKPANSKNQQLVELDKIKNGTIKKCEDINQFPKENCVPAKFGSNAAAELMAANCTVAADGSCRSQTPDEAAKRNAELQRLRDVVAAGNKVACKDVSADAVKLVCEIPDLQQIVNDGRKNCRLSANKDTCEPFPGTKSGGAFSECSDLLKDGKNCDETLTVFNDGGKQRTCALAVNTHSGECTDASKKYDVSPDATNCGDRKMSGVDKNNPASTTFNPCTADGVCEEDAANKDKCVAKSSGSYASCDALNPSFAGKARVEAKNACENATVGGVKKCVLAPNLQAPTCVENTDPKAVATYVATACVDRFGGDDFDSSTCNLAPAGVDTGDGNFSCIRQADGTCGASGVDTCAKASLAALKANTAASELVAYIGDNSAVDFSGKGPFERVCNAVKEAGKPCEFEKKYVSLTCGTDADALSEKCLERTAAACTEKNGKTKAGADEKACLEVTGADGEVCVHPAEVFTEVKYASCAAVQAASKEIATTREPGGADGASYEADCTTKGSVKGTAAKCALQALTKKCVADADKGAATAKATVVGCGEILPAQCNVAAGVHIAAGSGAEFTDATNTGSVCHSADGVAACEALKIGFTNSGFAGDKNCRAVTVAIGDVEKACRQLGDKKGAGAGGEGQCIAAHFGGIPGSTGICQKSDVDDACKIAGAGVPRDKLNDVCQALVTAAGATKKVRAGDVAVDGFENSVCAAGTSVTVTGQDKTDQTAAKKKDVVVNNVCSIQ